MDIGLKRGIVELVDHDPNWDKLAAETIKQLWEVFGSMAKELQQRFDILDFEPITKGLSNDKKYYIETSNGQRLLLRMADIVDYDSKKVEFERMQHMDAAGVPMSRPVEFGVCDDGKKVYQLLTWCDGDNLETVLPLLSETEQCVTGLKVGEILRKIHSVPAPESTEDWQDRYFKVIDERIQAFLECGVQFDGWENIIRYYENNRHLLKGRPQSCLHGDFHAGNLLLADNRDVSVIDWQILDFEGYGDPWIEFRSDQCAVSPHYATGCIHGYFDGEPPLEFWHLLAFYMSVGTITSIPWAFYLYPAELDSIITLNLNILSWFDNMNNTVPTWYLKDFYIQWIDGVPYKLKAPFDFSFLSKYGKVFKVFDDQDSGNICFGIVNGENRYFIKFAGAPTERACVSAEEAVTNLKGTVPIYKDLAHPNLIKFVGTEEIGGGFAMVYEGADAECMHPMYPLSRKKFMQMAIETRHQVFEDILAFHAHVSKQRYVAIDFYDGSIMYDFHKGRTVICDIDFYAKAPYINSKGRLWGSSRFMSPEEFQLGAVIDEITNVYTMGATAFALFGDERDRCIEKWKLSKELFDVAKKAISYEREKRQQSIEQLIKEWKEALFIIIE